MTKRKYGRYEIESELGRGGMATVYLAYDPRFGRKVALKVMSQALRDDPTFRGRFEREARIIATLEHAAIVPVYDYGEERAQPYLVMRHMPGGTLADRIIAGPLSLETAVPIIQRLASALDHAHQQGVIHRDLKPSNILFDQYNNAFLTDFGIVKLAQGGNTNLTGSGVIGTPAYMSPEQIHGEKTLDGRSDIYTLGIILFEMLTGRKPYRADTPIKQMMAHVLNPIPQIRDMNPDLPDDFEQVIQQVLAKERDARFRSGTELTEAISRTLPGLLPQSAAPGGAAPTVEAPTVQSAPLPAVSSVSSQEEAAVPESMPVQLPEPVRKRPLRWIGLMLLGLLLVAAIVWGPGLLATPDPSETAVPIVLVLPTPGQTRFATSTVSASPQPPTATLRATSPTVAVPLPTPVLTTIGQSANGTPIEAVRIGTGARTIIFVGGLHAGFAPGSVELAEQVIAYYSEDLIMIPANISLIIIPNANPDSPRAPGKLAGRLNGNGVDLNRNWDCRWLPDPTWGTAPVEGLGGTEPFSEPEVRSLSNFIVAQNSTAVIFWQARSAQGLVSPGECFEGESVSQTLAEVYGGATDYRVDDFEDLVDTVVPGDATNWLDQQGIPAISVLLTDYTATDFAQNRAAIDAVIHYYAEQNDLEFGE